MNILKNTSLLSIFLLVFSSPLIAQCDFSHVKSMASKFIGTVEIENHQLENFEVIDQLGNLIDNKFYLVTKVKGTAGFLNIEFSQLLTLEVDQDCQIKNDSISNILLK